MKQTRSLKPADLSDTAGNSEPSPPPKLRRRPQRPVLTQLPGSGQITQAAPGRPVPSLSVRHVGSQGQSLGLSRVASADPDSMLALSERRLMEFPLLLIDWLVDF